MSGMEISAYLINGGPERQGIKSIVERPARRPQDPFSHFGNKNLCTHFDVVFRKPDDDTIYRTEVEESEPVRIPCKNKKSRGGATGFLCDFHASSLSTGKPRRVSPRPDFMVEARALIDGDAALIKASRVQRVRLITAGVHSVYLRILE
jgi:hypothetical protein